MQRSTKSTVTVAALALAAFVTSFTATTAGLPTVVFAEEGQGQAPPPPANTPPKPLVPVAASSVAASVSAGMRDDDRRGQANLTNVILGRPGQKQIHRQGVLVLAPTLRSRPTRTATSP
jgi:hypothetical protein